MSARRVRIRRAAFVVLFVLAAVVGLLCVHYARLDVVSKYPIDGVLRAWRYEGRMWKTLTCEFTADGTGEVIQVTVPGEGREVNDLAAWIPPTSRVRIYYERRAIWLPWEGSTRRAVGVDLLGPQTAAQ